MSEPRRESGPELIQRLSMGPLPSYAMLAGLQLDVFSRLAQGPLSGDQLAADLGVGSDRLSLLLHALAAIGLLELETDRFRNSPESEEFLTRGGPSYLGDIHEGLAMMWNAASLTEESIRSGEPRARVDFASMPEEDLDSFYRSFYGEALAAGRELARTHDFAHRASLIDVGGGSGGLSIALAEAWPHLDITISDLPSVVGITQRFVDDAGVRGRIHVAADDATSAPPKGRYDVAVLRALIQVLGPDDAARAIRNVSAALEPGGEMIIMGRILHDSRLSPVGSVLSNMVFLNIFEGGRSYTEGEHRAWLEMAGLVDVEFHIPSEGRSWVHARKPGEPG